MTGYGPGTDVPWLTETKQPGNTPSNDLDVGAFFEGAINLTDADLLACFSNFFGDSRSSNSLTADIKDYALDEFPLCSVAGSKVCSADPSQGFCLIADTACAVDGECNTEGDRCILDNPFVDVDGETIVMDNDIVITNDGVATVYDAAFKENTTFLAGESCALVAVNGVAVTPVDLTDGAFHTVPGNGGDYDQSLASGESVTVTITCETERNPFPNQVDMSVATVDGEAADLFVTGVDLDTTTDACTVAPNPMIGLAKECVDVQLVTAEGALGLQVITEITVTNTGVEALDPVTVTDTVGGTLTTTLALAPGESMSYLVVDQPSEPDITPANVCSDNGAICNSAADCGDPLTATCDPTTDVYSPVSAKFDNTANASGTGVISGVTADAAPADESCPLCPTTE